jgi:hypothetical protein
VESVLEWVVDVQEVLTYVVGHWEVVQVAVRWKEEVVAYLVLRCVGYHWECDEGCAPEFQKSYHDRRPMRDFWGYGVVYLQLVLVVGYDEKAASGGPGK